MSWLPRRVFIRLQGGTRKKRERERAAIRRTAEERSDPREATKRDCTSMFCTNHTVHKMAVYIHRSQVERKRPETFAADRSFYFKGCEGNTGGVTEESNKLGGFKYTQKMKKRHA